MSTPASRGSPSTSPTAANHKAATAGRGGSATAGRGAAIQFALVMLPLLLALAVVHQFAIEERRHLPAVFALAVATFAVHYWLPRKLRMPLFLAASLASLFLVLDARDALYVIVIGAGLIGVCWLPISGRLRIALLLLAAGNLAVWRKGADDAFWPVLGAMFMFRLILYVFETHKERSRASLADLSYFFLLPNACFTLFPVIDYATFRRTYYDRPEQEIYQTGVLWICRGLMHLLLYRAIKYFVLPAPHEIDDLPHLALFLAANYALYLRVSGQFHLITGLLHLFGFNLPATHHWYFLATSFTDIWRRINIYWKDFMQKVFFFPVFFRLRRLGTIPAMLSATAAVFLATWLLHSYQLFWLLGDFPLTTNDALLWLSVGALVAINGLIDLRRARRATATPWSWTIGAVNSLKALGMFAAVSVFWGRWTDPELFAMFSGPLLSTPSETSFPGVIAVLSSVLVIVIAGAVVQRIYSVWQRLGRPLFASPLQCNMALIAVVAALGSPPVRDLLSPDMSRKLASLQSDLPTAMEASRLLPGYYELITEADLQSQVYRETLERRKHGLGPLYTAMTRPTGDMLELELIPNWRGEFAGKQLTVNRLGMRDGNVEQEKPADTTRIALVGSSIVMGYGVADDEVFDQLLEERLNAPNTSQKYELLNFGTGRYYAIQRQIVIHRKVLAFRPDAIFYFAHQDEYTVANHFSKYAMSGAAMPSACLEQLASRAHRAAAAAPDERRALWPKDPEILDCVYRSITAECRGRGILPVWVFLPMPGIADAPMQVPALSKLAAEAGFVVLELSDWSAGRSPAEVKLDALDYHPNAEGHRLIAERLEGALRRHPEALPVK